MLGFGTVVLLGDFNARIGRSDDVIGVFARILAVKWKQTGFLSQ